MSDHIYYGQVITLWYLKLCNINDTLNFKFVFVDIAHVILQYTPITSNNKATLTLRKF